MSLELAGQAATLPCPYVALRVSVVDLRSVEKKPNKHEQKTRETRALLLQAAETVFMRDGFEGAELGEIARLAGRTKGAIYAQFKGKEDMFLALINEHTQRYRQEMEHLLAGSRSQEENRQALHGFYRRLAEDKGWALLFLEFKLYAIRHPESRERLQQHMDEVMPGDQEKRLVDLLGAPGDGQEVLRRTVAVQSMQPLLSSLAVESQLFPHLLDEAAMRLLTDRLFAALLDA